MVLLFFLYNINLINISNVCIGGSYFDVKIKDSLIYFATGRGLEIYHRNLIKNNPISRFPTDGWAYALDVKENYVYIADYYNGICILDVKNPQKPKLLKTIKTGDNAADICVENTYAYIADGKNGLLIFKVKNPNNPSFIGKYSKIGNAFSVTIKDTMAFIGTTDSSMKILSIKNPAKPILISEFPFEHGTCIDCCIEDTLIYVNCAYLSSGKTVTFAILNIKNLKNPIILAELDITLTNKGIKKIGHYIYTNTQHNGVTIIDVTNPQLPIIVKQICKLSDFGYGYDSFDNYLIIPQYFDGFEVVDIKCPQAPKTYYKHENINWNYICIDHHNIYLCVIGSSPSSNNSILRIYNVENSKFPILMGEYKIEGKAILYDNSVDFPYLVLSIINKDDKKISQTMEIINISQLPNFKIEKQFQVGGIAELYYPNLYILDKNVLKTVNLSKSKIWRDSIVLPDIGYDLLIKDTLAFITSNKCFYIFDLRTSNEIGYYYHNRSFAVNISYNYPLLSIPYTPVTGSTYGFLVYNINQPAKPKLVVDTIIYAPAVNQTSISIMGSTFYDNVYFLGRGNYGLDIWKFNNNKFCRIATHETPYSATHCYPSGNSNIICNDNVIYLIDRGSLEVYDMVNQ